jgi:hypothetical protein
VNRNQPVNDIAAMSPEQIEDELLKLDIAERFDGDVAWLTRLYDGDWSDQKRVELMAQLERANPHRSGIYYPDGAAPISHASVDITTSQILGDLLDRIDSQSNNKTTSGDIHSAVQGHLKDSDHG